MTTFYMRYPSSVWSPAKGLRPVLLDRIRQLHRYLEQNRLVQGVVAVASFPIGAVQKWLARYRQSRLAYLPDSAAPTERADRLHHPVPGVPFRRQKGALRACRWIHDDDREQFHCDGYMVIRGVVPSSLVAKAAREIAAFVRADLADSTTWYRGPLALDGIVPMHHAQSLWDIRQCPNLYDVFAEFFGTARLMVDMNRCIFRPPVHRRFPKISRGTIHWDTDPRGPQPASVQGVVLLSDVCRNGGGFQCLPDVYRNLDGWLKRYAPRHDFNFFYPGLNHWHTTQVDGKAGDVILWSTELPHGSAINLSNCPRIAAFVSMQPCGDNAQLRESMRTWWLTKRAPDFWRGLPGQLDPEPGPPAALSDLGLKLIGISSW